MLLCTHLIIWGGGGGVSMCMKRPHLGSHVMGACGIFLFLPIVDYCSLSMH